MAKLPINYKNIRLEDLMPRNLTVDKNVLSAARAIDIELHKVAEQTDELFLISMIDRLSEATIDLLAWQWHVDFYDEKLTIEQKRELVKTSIAWHRKKGTKFAVQQMVDIVYTNAKVEEWHEYGGEHYFFRVSLNSNAMNLDEINRVIKLINIAKNARSWLESLTFRRQLQCELFAGGAMTLHKKINIDICYITDANLIQRKYFAGASNIYKKIKIDINTVSDNVNEQMKYFAGMNSTFKRYIINNL